jgi:hypothetical protein
MRALAVILSSIFILGCGVDSGNESAAIRAARLSALHAEKDGVDLNRYAINSIRSLAFGKQGAVRPEQTSPHIERVREKLKDKEYWEICYGASSKGVVGSQYCYYLDDSSFDLLTVYRTK